ADVPETVLITGSLIRGAPAVGVPVTSLRTVDFAETGALTTAELFKTIPAALVAPIAGGQVGPNNIERSGRVNLRGIDTGSAPRGLLMVDGIRVAPTGSGQCAIDPSIIPAIALERIDVLVDGASATYGADAVSGVINIILKRNYDGAIARASYTRAEGGKNRYMASALWGRTWDGGSVVLSYEWYDNSPIMANTRSKATVDYTPWGLDNRIPIGSSMPGTISSGGASPNIGTGCTNCYAIPSGTGSPFDPGAVGIGPTTPFSGSTLNWATFNVPENRGTNGTRNIVDPWSHAWLDAAQQRNAATVTVDQRLTPNISFYGTGFYSNRRSQYLNQANVFPFRADLLSVAVPTFNPYYPTGGAPTNLRANYSLTFEMPPVTSAFEISGRYMGGLNIALPRGWQADIYYS
ncbi:MAG: TonB-dependent receptor plug domain-containing protein, partial [bacterium]